MQQASILLFPKAVKYCRFHLKANGEAEQTDLLIPPLKSVQLQLLPMYGVPSIFILLWLIEQLQNYKMNAYMSAVLRKTRNS